NLHGLTTGIAYRSDVTTQAAQHANCIQPFCQFPEPFCGSQELQFVDVSTRFCMYRLPTLITMGAPLVISKSSPLRRITAVMMQKPHQFFYSRIFYFHV